MKTYMMNNTRIDLHAEKRTKHEVIQGYVADTKREGKEEHFFVCDVGDIIQKYQQWVRLLPRVKLFYAVKCSSDQALLQILSDLGASFDCASKAEIDKVLDLGVDPKRVIYTHTHKPINSLVYARCHNVSLLAFDSKSELHKIKLHHPTASLILRILPQEQFDATDSFENKFGCPSFQTRDLLQLAKELELRVDGVSFHVGTGIKDPRAYIAALKQSRDVFEIARGIGFNMKLLDIGGGFPGVQNTSDFFREITNVVNETLDDIFPPAEGVDIIAEPGRYVVASAYNVVVNIIGKRFFPENPLLRETGNATVKDICEGDSNTVMYYVNDSVFGSFLAGGLYEPGSIRYVPKLIKCEDDAVSHESMIWEFTCPPKDCLNPSVRMPELDVGDWLYFEDMGAYTNSISSNFNGLETPEIKYFCLESLWFEVFSGQPQRNE